MLYLKYGHGKWWHLAYVIASDGTCYATNFLVNSVDSECKMIDQKTQIQLMKEDRTVVPSV